MANTRNKTALRSVKPYGIATLTFLDPSFVQVANTNYRSALKQANHQLPITNYQLPITNYLKTSPDSTSNQWMFWGSNSSLICLLFQFWSVGNKARTVNAGELELST